MKRKLCASILSAALACLLLTGCGPSYEVKPESPMPDHPSVSPDFPLPPGDPLPDQGGSQGGGSSQGGGIVTKFQPQIVNYSWHVSPRANKAEYIITIHNPNKATDILFTKLDFVVRDASGKIIKTYFCFAPKISAGDTVTFTGNVLVSGQAGVPERMSLEYSSPSYGFVPHDRTKVAKKSDFRVFNVNYIPDNVLPSITGEITNIGSASPSTVVVSIVYNQGGSQYAGPTSYVHNLSSGQTKSFQVLIMDEIEFDSYQVYISHQN